MSTSFFSRLTARLIRHEAILEKLYDTMDELASSPVQRFDLDTSEGEQEVLEKRIDRIQDSIDKEEAIIDSIENKLRRTGLIALNNRRR